MKIFLSVLSCGKCFLTSIFPHDMHLPVIAMTLEPGAIFIDLFFFLKYMRSIPFVSREREMLEMIEKQENAMCFFY
jgi:hypothetical protein